MPEHVRTPVILGAGMTRFGKQPDRSLRDLAGEAATLALADAGLDAQSLDAVFAANSGAGILTGQESVRAQVSLKGVGIAGMPMFNVENACASGSTAVHLAVAYIRAGAARCVLAIGYEKMVTQDKTLPMRALEACSDIEELTELKARLDPADGQRSIFMDFYAEKIRAYFERTQAKPEHLAWIAAKNHGNGALNPKAQFQTARSVTEILQARTIVDPLTLLMCSPISDGAAAVVVAEPAWATAHGLAGPSVLATRMATDNLSTQGSQMADLAQSAYAEAGLDAQAIDVAEVHDATAAGELFEYENLGFAAPGEGWKLIETGDVALGGRIPVNPSGGLLSRGHPIGATGVAQVCELAWQLRGEAGERQVRGAKVAVAQCAGGQTSFGRTSGAAALSLVVLHA